MVMRTRCWQARVRMVVEVVSSTCFDPTWEESLCRDMGPSYLGSVVTPSAPAEIPQAKELLWSRKNHLWPDSPSHQPEPGTEDQQTTLTTSRHTMSRLRPPAILGCIYSYRILPKILGNMSCTNLLETKGI